MSNLPTLRDYQLASQDGIATEFKAGNMATLCVLPTGAGKTTVFAGTAHKAVAKGSRVWAIAHREELVTQLRERAELFGLSVGTMHPDWGKKYDRPIQVCMVQTLVNRLAYIRPDQMPNLVFVDEAHRAVSPTYLKVLEILRTAGARLIGLTATPWRLDKKAMGDQFDSIVAPISISEMIARGFLLLPRYYGTDIDLDKLKTKGNDYDTDELFKRFNKRELYSGTVNNYLNFGQDLPAVCYCINVRHSEKTRDAFLEAGIPAAHVDGETPPGVRKKIIDDYKAGVYQVLCNADLFTEGLDIPRIGCVILNRATQSLALYIQMVGRGGRPIAGMSAATDAERVAAVAASEKPRFVVIDQGSNIRTHGFWEDEREYSLEAPEKKRKKAGGSLDVSPIKFCPSCALINKAQARACEECGFVWPDAMEKAKEADFLEINRNEVRIGGLTVSTVRAGSKFKAVPPHLEGVSEYDWTEGDWVAVGKLSGYKPGWQKHRGAWQKNFGEGARKEGMAA